MGAMPKSESLMMGANLISNNTIRFLTIVLVYDYFCKCVDRLTAYILDFTVVGNSYRPIAIKNNYNKMCSRYGLKIDKNNNFYIRRCITTQKILYYIPPLFVSDARYRGGCGITIFR